MATIDTSISPELLWDRDRLLMNLSLGWQNLSEEADPDFFALYQAYARFYQVDFTASPSFCAQSIRYVKSARFNMVVQRFVPSNPEACAFICHGYFDHAGLYGSLIEVLLDKGVEVVVFDLPGHGLSSGDRAAISCFSDYQHAFNDVVLEICNEFKHWGEGFSLIGQSTGAAIIADSLLQEDHQFLNDVKLKQAILLAPLLRPKAWGKAEFMHSLIKNYKKYWPRSFRPNSHSESFVEFIKKSDPMQHSGLSVDWIGALRKWVPEILSRPASFIPISIIQGTDDETVDWEFNLANYRRLFPNARITVIEHAKHQLVNEAEPYKAKVFDAVLAALGR
jgi:lysophospholipase